LLRELIPTLLLQREGLIGGINITFNMLTEKIRFSFIFVINLSLFLRERLERVQNEPE